MPFSRRTEEPLPNLNEDVIQVSWRNGTHPSWRARFCATRVTPAHDWRDRPVAPEVWLLCERALGASDRTKYYLVHLPATASLRTLVRLTHQRWAIEQGLVVGKDWPRRGWRAPSGKAR